MSTWREEIELQINGLRPWRENTQMGSIHASLKSGQRLLVYGPVGAGKSAFLKAFVGSQYERDGSIRLGDVEIGGSAAYRAGVLGVSFMPQRSLLFADLTSLENLQLAWELACEKRGDHGWRWDRALENVLAIAPHLRNLLKRKASVLSGGEQKVVGLARLWITRPKLALLDEPGNGLDLANRAWMNHIIVDMCNRGTIVIATAQDRECYGITFSFSLYLRPGRAAKIEATQYLGDRTEAGVSK